MYYCLLLYPSSYFLYHPKHSSEKCSVVLGGGKCSRVKQLSWFLLIVPSVSTFFIFLIELVLIHFFVGKIDRKSIGGLINSISTLLHLVSCQTSKSAIINELKCIAGTLMPLKCILDEAFGSPFPWDERLVTTIEELDLAVNEA
jgi:hypothetical protein